MRIKNFTTLAWHSNIEEQAHRRSYAFGQIHPIVCPIDTLPPFQLVRQHTGNGNWRVGIVDIEGNERDITQDMEYMAEAYMHLGTYYDNLVYNGGNLGNNVVPEGLYYLHASDGRGNDWFSDVFAATSDIDNYMRIEWWDESDFEFDGGRIVYDGGNFHNILYVKSELGKPEYTYEEEGEERDGIFFPSKQLATKTYRFSFMATEAVCDALRFARLSEVVRITDSFGNEYNADTFLMTPEWQEQGDLANIVVEFTSGTVAKKLGLGYFRKK